MAKSKVRGRVNGRQGQAGRSGWNLWAHSRPVVPRLGSASESVGELAKIQVAGPPTPEFRVQSVWGGAQEFAFRTDFQGLLTSLVRGPHFESRCDTGRA